VSFVKAIERNPGVRRQLSHRNIASLFFLANIWIICSDERL
jgi:hypothetical protein